MEVVLLFGLVIGFLMIGVPIAISLGLSSVLFLLWFSDSSLASVAATLFQAFEGHFTLMAIPFFILASAFMTTGGVARRIIRFSIACVGHLRGGLAISGVFACMMFAALSGSSPATVVAVGSIVIAGMMKVGYTKDFAAGVIANAGTLGILIPPSIVMVVYASTVEVSVGRMFLAGVIPGLLAGLMLMVAIYVFAVLRDLPKGEWPGWTEVAESILDAAFGLFLIVIILGGIYGGIFTPTEAAAVASVYAFFIAVFVYRDMGPLKGKGWLNADEQARFGFGLRIVVFALVGFALHVVASRMMEAYAPETGLWVGIGWIAVTLLFGWALTQFQFHRGRIAFGLICLIGILPALIYIATNIGGLSSTVTGWMGAVTASTLLASLGAAALMLLWVLVVVVVLVLPPTIFAFSMTKASEDAAAVSEGFVTGVGGGVMSLLRGTGEGILWMLPSFVHHDTRKTLFEAGKLTITLLFVIANALILKHVLTDEQIPQKIAGAMLDAGFGPVMFLIMVNVILLIGGQFMEPSGLLVIVAPLVFPIAIELGIDPIHLGIIMVVNMEIGMITPPVGLNLFVTSGVANMPMMSVVRAALPFTAVLFVFLIIVTYVPAISTLLPNYFMGPEIITN